MLYSCQLCMPLTTRKNTTMCSIISVINHYIVLWLMDEAEYEYKLNLLM